MSRLLITVLPLLEPVHDLPQTGADLANGYNIATHEQLGSLEVFNDENFKHGFRGRTNSEGIYTDSF